MHKTAFPTRGAGQRGGSDKDPDPDGEQPRSLISASPHSSGKATPLDTGQTLGRPLPEAELAGRDGRGLDEWG